MALEDILVKSGQVHFGILMVLVRLIAVGTLTHLK